MANAEWIPTKRYPYDLPVFSREGKITSRVRVAVSNVLEAYAELARLHASKTDNNPRNYEVDSINIVGSSVRERRDDSDLDLMLITPKLDERTTRELYVSLALLFFVNRLKRQAVDIYVRTQDKYPDRSSQDITFQVVSSLQRCNRKLKGEI